MFKLKTQDDYILKSHDIFDLWKFVVSHPDWSYQFYMGYIPISNDEFLKTFLIKSGRYHEYLILYRSIKPQIDIHQWVQKQEQSLT